MSDEVIPYLAGTQEFAAVCGVAPQQVSLWVKRGHIDYSNAVIISGKAYWPLAEARRHAGAPDEAALKAVIAEQEHGRWADDVSEVPPLVGLQEIAELLHVTRIQAGAMYRSKGQLGEADRRVSGAPLWLLDRFVADVVPALREKSRTKDWVVDAEVEAAIRERRYEGPGSCILPRGRAAK
ncbi:hypothetical protein GCM10020367_20740 [Streptomyces sannanensis]|uniref:DNA-binding protein n=1 Tax=Streptomyces sannanensis TaxID=285536 RepID=A0ABP6S9S4_9ACTN